MANQLKSVNGKLSKQDRTFVETYVRTGDVKDACRESGVTAGKLGWMWKRSEIQLAVQAELAAKVVYGAALGQVILEDLAGNSEVSDSVRLNAAVALRKPFIDATLKTQQSRSEDRSLAEQSIDELRSLVDRLEGERARAARPVGGDLIG